MKNRCSFFSTAALALALSIVAVEPRVHAEAASTAVDVKGISMSDLKDMDKKFLDLAKAMPADKYDWRPGDGVRSVGEVFMHVAQMNYMFPSMMGAPASPDFTMKGFEKSATQKDKIVAILTASIAYSEGSIDKLGDADLQKSMKMFGRTMSGYAMLINMTGDLHEHLGQAIAYARTNSVVPPWTAARQAKQGAQ
jgi:uncharacterized damage-inducible protein DinB